MPRDSVHQASIAETRTAATISKGRVVRGMGQFEPGRRFWMRRPPRLDSLLELDRLLVIAYRIQNSGPTQHQTVRRGEKEVSWNNHRNPSGSSSRRSASTAMTV